MAIFEQEFSLTDVPLLSIANVDLKCLADEIKKLSDTKEIANKDFA